MALRAVAQAPTGGGGGSGTVTSVGLTGPAIFSITGVPITTAGTIVLTPNGTSGGVPFFDGAKSMASSGVLAANQLVVGGGAGLAPATIASPGTTTTVLHGNAAGPPSFGAVSLTADVSGTLPVKSGGTGLTGGTSGGVPFYDSANTIASSALLPANAILLGGGAGAAPAALGSLGTTKTVLHGNAAGAPTFGAVSLTADVSGTLPVANGGIGATSLSAVFVGRQGSIEIQLSGGGVALVNGTYYFTINAPVGFTINSATAQTASGTFTANVQIGGVSVTGLAAIAVTSTPGTTNATAANTVTAGNTVLVVVTVASSAMDAVVQLNITYT